MAYNIATGVEDGVELYFVSKRVQFLTISTECIIIPLSRQTGSELGELL